MKLILILFVLVLAGCPDKQTIVNFEDTDMISYKAGCKDSLVYLLWGMIGSQADYDRIIKYCEDLEFLDDARVELFKDLTISVTK